MLNIKVDLFTSYISKVCKFTQHCLLCIKKVENIRPKKNIFAIFFDDFTHRGKADGNLSCFFD